MKALTYQPSTARWIVCKLVGAVRPSVFWSGLSGLRYQEIAVPALPNASWVRLRTIMGGICGTDLALIFQKNHPSSYLSGLTSFPIVLGHENVALIDELGPAVTGWERGERVCVEPALSCEARGIEQLCPPCREGRFSLCENVTNSVLPKGTMIGLNAFTGGSWSPYFVAHHSQLHRVPDGLSDQQAVLTDPLACALHGVLRHRPRDDDRVLVVGGGIIGLGVVACLKALGSAAHVAVLARHPIQQQWFEKLAADEVIHFPRGKGSRQRYDEIARRMNAVRVDGRFGNYGLLGGFDVVYDCVGTGSSMTDSLKFTRARGTTVLLGTSNITLLDTTPVWNKELNVIGGYGRQIEHFGRRRLHTYELIFELIGEGNLDVEGLLTHTFDVRDYPRAFALFASKRRNSVIKAAFEFNSSGV